jgi:hypothetical protein
MAGGQRKLNRLAQMSRKEIRHRLAATARRRLGWLPPLAGAAHRDDGWVARILGDASSRAGVPAYLARVLATRVYGVDWAPARLAEGLTRAGAADRLVREADEICAHRLRVLGYGVCDAGPGVDWHRDPVTGARWPRRWWGFMTRGRAQGWDPKLVWEPSRHQHFLVLAAAAAVTGDVAYADEVADQLEGWIAQNPTGIGIHWVESIEPALRLLSWLWVLPLVLQSERFTPELCAAVLRSLVAQARHIAANLSTYTSPNTHLIAEALALFVVGTVLPELEMATAWRERGRAILEREIVVQVGDDGVYREASFSYHTYTVEFYLLAAVVAERNGVALAPVVRARLERMLEALAWLVRPDGTLANVGDGDGGRTLRFGAPNLARVDELLASGAVLYGRPDLRAGLAPRGEEAAWLWPDGVSRLARIGWAPAPRGWRHFADARLAVERRRVGADERWMLFDAGDLGMLSGGHGHAGCLGIELYAHGRALIVDRGTYAYNAAPAWRRHFRGTRAHSTVVVDGRDQAEHASEFRWATRYRSRIVRELATADYGLITGEHDGYRRLPDPVRHRRTMLSVRGEYWLCIDVLDGAGTHDAEFLFHLAPELEVTVGDGGAFAAAPGMADGLLVVGAGFEHAEPRVVTGATDPIQGWHSDDYGAKRPAPTLVTRETLRLPAVRVHLLAPVARAARPLRVETRTLGDGLALTVHAGRATDLVLCSPGGPRRFETDGVDFVGELLHARTGGDGELEGFLAVQARSVSWHDEVVMEAQGVAEWVAMSADRAGRRATTSPAARLVVPAIRNPHGRAGAVPASIERA